MTPNEKLTVVGGITATGDISLNTSSRLNFATGSTSTSIGRDGAFNGIDFITSNLSRMFITDIGNVGVGTSTPNEKLTVTGNVSATGNLTVGSVAAGSSDSVITELGGLLQKRTINPQIWNTSISFISAFDGNLDEGYIQKATSFNGLDKSILYENSSNIGVGTIDPNEKLTVVGSISASSGVYFNNHQAVKTVTTNVPGTSAITTILAVSALPASPDPTTVYIVI